MLNLTYRLTQSDTWLVNSLLTSHGLSEVSHNSNDFNLLWTGSHPRPHTFSSMKYYQRVNHFPRSYELTRKDRLFKNVAKFQHTYGAKHFDFLPPSFVMPNEYRWCIKKSCSNFFLKEELSFNLLIWFNFLVWSENFGLLIIVFTALGLWNL